MSQMVADWQPLKMLPRAQHLTNDDKELRGYEVKFGDLVVVKQRHTEPDGSTFIVLPNWCRLRNLTYSAEILVRFPPFVWVWF